MLFLLEITTVVRRRGFVVSVSPAAAILCLAKMADRAAVLQRRAVGCGGAMI